jgi:hypothetical protein
MPRILFSVVVLFPRTFRVQLFAAFVVYSCTPCVFTSKLVVADGAAPVTVAVSKVDVDMNLGADTPVDAMDAIKVLAMPPL